ncbi:RDD family protein [Actinomadura alba]|uniref:RDD family protein n=1 Tax=Actinomadura alba TaxID=406431 RepID=A0ABR7LVR0_9ACTN|nr:RDD family protein [Actinomadura alba]MBC6468550.1 RDD family protein [Actinomadura alba]
MHLPPQTPRPPQTPQSPQSDERPSPAGPALADPGIRFAARLLDTLFTFGCTIVIGVLITGIFSAVNGGDLDQVGAEFGIPMLVMIIGTPFVYEWVQVAKWGGTAGKRITGLRVVRATDGGPVPAGRAAVRALCYSPGIYYAPNLIPVLAQLNVLWMLWDKPLKQCWHDKAAKTIVVVTK